MATMRAVGARHRLPAHAIVRHNAGEYVIELDVAAFTEDELSVESLGPRLTVRGDQLEAHGDGETPFCLHERLEKSFRLPDDAHADCVRVFYRHGKLEIHAPRTAQLQPRELPIEHPSFVVHADAEAV